MTCCEVDDIVLFYHIRKFEILGPRERLSDIIQDPQGTIVHAVA